jgi:hypothetical protein
VPCWLLEEVVVDALISHALTPECVMREVAETQRLLDERRPHLDKEIARAEQAASEREVAVRQLLKLIQSRDYRLFSKMNMSKRITNGRI